MAQLRAFLAGTAEAAIEPNGDYAERYAFITRVVPGNGSPGVTPRPRRG